MAIDMFIKIGDLGGESMDKTHKGEIDVLAWSWGMSQSGTMHLGSGGGSGKVNVDNLSITKFIDAASCNIYAHCCDGTHIPEALLTLRKAGGTALEYMTIKLHKVLISSISTGASGGEDRVTENVVLNFAKFEVMYQPQDEKGAKAGGEKTMAWNIETNTPSIGDSA